jgi:large subunit ribosomal protein L24
MLRFKKGDEVLITAGKDKGKKAKIEKVFPHDQTAVLPNLNVYKRHVKKRDENNPGGVIPLARPLGFGKIALICPKCGKQTRVGFKEKENEKIRICKKCSARI